VNKPKTVRDVLYVLGNDLHRGRIRPAIVVRIHPNRAADLLVFCDVDESQNESGTDRREGIVFKTKVAYDAGTVDAQGARQFKSATWHEDPDSAVEAVSLLDQQITVLVDELAKLRDRVQKLESAPAPAPAATPEPAPAAPAAPEAPAA
jgi:hypothetical protein